MEEGTSQLLHHVVSRQHHSALPEPHSRANGRCDKVLHLTSPRSSATHTRPITARTRSDTEVDHSLTAGPTQFTQAGEGGAADE